MTIKIDNLQTFNNKLSLSMTEAICGVLETSMIHQVNWRNKTFVNEDPDWTITEVLDADDRVEYYHVISPSAAVEADLVAFAIDGSAVVLVNLETGCSILFGDDAGNVHCGVSLVDDWGNVDIHIIDQNGDVLLAWPYGAAGNMRIAMRQVTNYKLEIEYKTISVYVENEMLISYAIPDSQESTHVILRTLGEERQFSYLRIHEAGYVNDYTTLDPGENSRAALSRVVQGAPLTLYGRYDLSVDIYRAGNNAPPVDVTAYHMQTTTSQRKNINYRELRSAVRLVSAFPEADYFHDDSLDKVGTQFDIAQNPFIITARGAHNEAIRAQGETVKDFLTSDAKTYICPILEAADIVLLDSDEYTINSVDARLSGASYSGSYGLKKRYSVEDLLDE